MAKKGLDTTFLHYGIRKEDICLIETLCTEHKLEFDWVKEDLLKEFHERKIRNQEIDEKSIEKVRSVSESNRFLNEKKFHINEWINSSKIPKPPSFFNTGLVDEPLTISEDIVTTIKNTTEKLTLKMGHLRLLVVILLFQQ